MTWPLEPVAPLKARLRSFAAGNYYARRPSSRSRENECSHYGRTHGIGLAIFPGLGWPAMLQVIRLCALASGPRLLSRPCVISFS